MCSSDLRREALKGARYVFCVVRVGGLEAFAMDVDIPLSYGVDQCVPRSQANGGGSFFTPLLTGFIIGQALENMGNRGYRGAPMYRDRDGTYYSGSGYPVSRDYVTGRSRVRTDSFDVPSRYEAPTRVQSRSSVISRGGFGGGSQIGRAHV